MRLFLYFARMYPKHSLLMVGCLLLGALAEGLGLSSILSLLTLTTERGAPALTGKGHVQAGHVVSQLFSWLGLSPSISVLLSFVVICMSLKAVLVLVAQKQVGYTVAQVATDLRLALIRAVLAARWEYYLRQPVGGIATAFASESSRAAQSYLHSTTIVAQIIETLVYAALALMISWPVALGAAVVGFAILNLLARFVRVTRRSGKRQTGLMRAVVSRMTDVLYGVKPIKAMARESLLGHFMERETHALNHVLRREVWSKEVLKALQEPLVIMALALGLYLGLTYWSLPLTSLLMLGLLFNRSLKSLNKIQRQYQELVASESALWSLRSTIERSENAREVIHGTPPPPLTHAITLREVQFSYGEHPVLHGVSLTIPVGHITAIVGPSGAGKTSIADLIIGLIQPQAGHVWLDDIPLSEIDARAWRHMVGYVPQETFLLHESVLVNVTLGDPAITEAQAEAALRAAEAWDFVAAMPDGIHTAVGERGARLSGGQRQRIAIARALVHRPQLLILDEATASLDPVSEAAICATVRTLRGQTTILAISPQPALLQVADSVYRLDKGLLSPAVVYPPTTPQVARFA
jgi:ATP-binding cassette, subfamily C, bacterial